MSQILKGPNVAKGRALILKKMGSYCWFNTVHVENKPERKRGKVGMDTGQSVDLLEEMKQFALIVSVSPMKHEFGESDEWGNKDGSWRFEVQEKV